MIETARTKALFAKVARRKVVVPDDLADLCGALLARRCVELLGLARRGGGAVAGFEKVRAALKEEPGGLLLEARDGSGDGRAKIGRLAAAVGEVPVSEALTADELGQAMGRDRTVHVLVRPGRLATLLRAETSRLAGVRGGGAEGRAEN